jgi:hypothetical protein
VINAIRRRRRRRRRRRNVESVEWEGSVQRKHALEERVGAPYFDDVTYVHRPEPVQGKASLITEGSPYKGDNTTRPSAT